MSKNKLLAFLFVFFTAVIFTVNGNSFVIGRRQYADRLVCNGKVIVPARFNVIPSTQYYCKMPRWNQRINFINATDGFRNGSGGYVEIMRGGGIGMNNVTLHFWNQRSRPVNFNIQVFGNPA